MELIKKKVFTTAPLPFMGQKRKFLKEVKKVIADCPESAVYVDLFGGSGLLSHTVKNHLPNATVVYNDYDNYRLRIANIDKTNAILADLRVILRDCLKDRRIVDPYRQKVLNRLKCESGFVDWITLSSSLLFSMKYVLSYEQMEKETMYNCVRQGDYSADGYLDGLTVVSMDYKALFEQYKEVENVVFLVDPPYLSTDVGTYKNYWKLKDYLDVLKVLEGTNYIYFTSNKSQIVELCEWMQDKPALYNPFAGSTTVTMQTQVNYSASYTDIMLHNVNYVVK